MKCLLQLLSQCGCQRWVYLGSQAEYGSLNGILPEDLPTRPITLCGVTNIISLLGREKPALTLGEQHWDYLYVE